jgi:hypothetical protein
MRTLTKAIAATSLAALMAASAADPALAAFRMGGGGFHGGGAWRGGGWHGGWGGGGWHGGRGYYGGGWGWGPAVIGGLAAGALLAAPYYYYGYGGYGGCVSQPVYDAYGNYIGSQPIC